MSGALRGWNTIRELIYLRLDLEALAALDPEAPKTPTAQHSTASKKNKWTTKK